MLLKQREPWHSHVIAQRLLPAHQRYLLDQPDLRSAQLASQRATAYIQCGQAVLHELNFPELRPEFVATSPAADAVAVYTSEQLATFDLWDRSVSRWRFLCRGCNSSEIHACWSPDSSMLMIYSSATWFCRVLSSRDGTVLGVWRPRCKVMCSAWQPDSASIALVYGNGSLDVLRPGITHILNDRGMDVGVPDHEHMNHCLKWAPNGQVLVHCTDYAVRFCTSAGSCCASVDFEMRKSLVDCAWSSTSNLLAVSFRHNAHILIYNAKAVCVNSMKTDSPYAQLAWAGDCLAAQCHSCLQVLSTADADFGTKLSSVPLKGNVRTGPAWHISGEYLAFSSADCSTKVVHAKSGSTVWAWCSESCQAADSRPPKHSPIWSASGQQLFFYARHGGSAMMATFG